RAPKCPSRGGRRSIIGGRQHRNVKTQGGQPGISTFSAPPGSETATRARRVAQEPGRSRRLKSRRLGTAARDKTSAAAATRSRSIAIGAMKRGNRIHGTPSSKERCQQVEP